MSFCYVMLQTKLKKFQCLLGKVPFTYFTIQKCDCQTNKKTQHFWLCQRLAKFQATPYLAWWLRTSCTSKRFCICCIVLLLEVTENFGGNKPLELFNFWAPHSTPAPIRVKFLVWRSWPKWRGCSMSSVVSKKTHNNNNNSRMLEWPSPTGLFTLLSWYYFATFAMLIGVVSYSFLASWICEVLRLVLSFDFILFFSVLWLWTVFRYRRRPSFMTYFGSLVYL